MRITETIAATSIITVNMEFVGWGGRAGGLAIGVGDTRGRELSGGWPGETDSPDMDVDCPSLLDTVTADPSLNVSD
jgi:hypothetical protein